MNQTETNARQSNDSALDHFEDWKEGRADRNETALLEARSHDTGIHAAAVKAGHPSGIAFLRDHAEWDQPMRDIFKRMEAPAPTWTYTTAVKDLTEADLEDEIAVIAPGTGHRNHWTLGRLIRNIRSDLERRGDPIQEDRRNEDLEVNDWIQWSDWRIAQF